MIAPDPEKGSGAPSTPEALAAGQRTLAAIVFTDVVNFSKLMSKDEELTLRLVARDLEKMKAACGEFGGQVLKSTGDGLLMLFTSAVQAVACALEIQRDFQRQNLELPREEQLQHRIGIHLGDVFQSGNDVMGDGVNIAARLQTEAVPGGICLSQTVYDVVRNRLSFYVNDLGARTLKNIGKVTAYQISPEENGPSRFRFSWYRWKTFLSTAAAWVVLPLLVVVFYLGVHREYARNHKGVYTILPVTHTPEPPPRITAGVPAASIPEPANGKEMAVSQQEFEMVRFDEMRKYDFEGMRDWIATHDWPEKETSQLDENCLKMQHLLRWLQESLHAYSASRPLVITSPHGKQTSFWTVSFGGLRMKTGDQVLTVMREQIPPKMIVEIIEQLQKENPTPPAENAKIEEELRIFKEFYQVKPAEVKATPPT